VEKPQIGKPLEEKDGGLIIGDVELPSPPMPQHLPPMLDSKEDER
jgi:hypothetical protein